MTPDGGQGEKRRLRVGVVGGSIAGCAAAIELSRIGCDVAVFERSRGTLTGRGAGIGTPTSTFDLLVERDLIDADMPRSTVSRHPFVGSSDVAGPTGQAALVLPLDMALVNWGDLFGNLRKRVPDHAYRSGVGVVGLGAGGDGRALELDDGSRYEADLVVFADGYRSFGRRTLFPDARLSYRGYVLWRGVLEEAELGDASPLEDALYRIHYQGLPGNAVFYFVPGSSGSTNKGERWVNWACYVPVAEEDLPEFLTDRDGRRHESSLPPGAMRLEEEARLKGLMGQHLPPYFAQIVAGSADTFAQPIYTVTVPAYAKQRCCLLGDAGSVAQPFTGSGVFKATNNATDLARTLSGGQDLDRALSEWSDAQARTGQRLTGLGRQMEQAFVWAAPDFGRMEAAAARAWWSEAVTFPDEFSYVGEEGD
jgi:2-polyprenyl-6-methoxyphenol hydroxylase-like FAD-dependent oxidoreductase